MQCFTHHRLYQPHIVCLTKLVMAGVLNHAKEVAQLQLSVPVMP